MCGISSAKRECEAAEIYRHLARLAATERSSLHSRERFADLLFLRARRDLHALPWIGLHGGKHARALNGRLSEVFHADRHRLGQHVEEGAREIGWTAHSDSRTCGSQFDACAHFLGALPSTSVTNGASSRSLEVTKVRPKFPVFKRTLRMGMSLAQLQRRGIR